MPDTENTTSPTLSHPHADADVAYEYVCFAECDENIYDVSGDEEKRLMPDPTTATPLKTYTESVEDPEGESQDVTRERWLYCFRLERAGGDGQQSQAAYVQEYYVSESGTYQRVVGSGPDRTVSEKERKAIKLKVKGVYDPEPEHFFWLSDVQLSASRIAQLREDLRADSIHRNDGSRKEDLRDYIQPVSLHRSSTPDVLRLEDDETPVENDKARYVVNLVHTLTVAERLHSTFQDSLYAYVGWMSQAAPVKQITDVTLQLCDANDDLRGELRMDGERTEAEIWREKYKEKEERLSYRNEDDNAVEQTLRRLLACLKTKAFTASLIDHVTGSDEMRRRGLKRYASLIQDLDVSETGRKYLDEHYRRSDLYDAVADVEEQMEDSSASDSPEARRRRVQRIADAITEGCESAKEESGGVATVSTFDIFTEVIGHSDKFQKAVFGILGEYAAVIKAAHPVASLEVMISLPIATQAFVYEEARAVVEIGEHGFPRVVSQSYMSVAIRRDYAIHMPLDVQLYEIREVENTAQQISDSSASKALQGWFAIVNLVLAGISLENWTDSPVATTGGMMAAVGDVTSFVLSTRVQDATQARYQPRVASAANQSGSRTAATLGGSAGRQAAQRGARIMLIALARAGIVIDVVVGAWSVSKELRQGDYDGAVAVGIAALGSVALSTGGFLAAASSMTGTGVTLLGSGPVGWIAAGVGFIVLGLLFMFSLDEDDVGIWLQDVNLWGYDYDDHSMIDFAQSLIGPSSGPGILQSAPEEVAGQLEKLYRILYAFDVSVDYEYPHSTWNFDSSDDVGLTVVRIQRAYPSVPLPPQAEWRVSFEAPRAPDNEGLPDTTIYMKDEILARSGGGRAAQSGRATQRFLVESNRYPEPEGTDVETAEELVLRYIDGSPESQQLRLLQDYEHGGDRSAFPIGIFVPNRQTVEPRREPDCAVTFSLGDRNASDAGLDDIDETFFTITEDSGW